MNTRVSPAVAAILDAALRGELTETQAQQLYAYGPEAVTLVLLTITRHADVPYENNFAERQIRPAVILRKNSLSNRSERGASMQAVLMSVYRTLKLRGLNPTETIAAALRTCVATGKLPPLPDPAIAHG